MEDDMAWHLDKRVPISIILVVLIQIVSFLWLEAKQQFTIDLLVSRVDRVEEQQRANQRVMSDNREQVLVISERLAHLRQQNDKIIKEVESIKQSLSGGKGGS